MDCPDFDYRTLMSKYVPKYDEVKDYEKKLKKVSEEAYWEAQKQFLKTCYLRQMVSNLAEGKIEDYSKLPLKQLKMLQDECDRYSSKSPYYFITINPRQDVDFKQLQKCVNKLLNKKCITNHAYAYEVRKKEDDKFIGLHCHLIVHQTIKSFDFKRGVKNTCKNICDVDNPHILNFKNLPTEEIIHQKFAYISGDKTQKKNAGVRLTQEWRQQNNIPTIFESNPPLPCRVAKIQSPKIEEIQSSEHSE